MQHLTTIELGLKAKSKNEVYILLVTEGGLHLPPMKEANYYYIASILCGDKQVCNFDRMSLFIALQE